MNRFFFIAALLFLAWAEPASAYLPIPQSCRDFFGGEADLPAQARPYFDDGEMLTICQYTLQPGQTYLIANQPERGLRGTCLVRVGWLDPEKDAPGDRLDPARPFIVLMLKTAAAECPRQNDPRYIKTTDIPESLFLAALDLVERISAGAPVGDIFAPADLDPHSPRRLTGTNDEPETEAGWIDKAKGGRLLAVKPLGINWIAVPAFTVDIGAAGQRWGLSVDIFDGKLKIVYASISSRGINE